MAFDDLELSKTFNGYICFPFLRLSWFLSFTVPGLTNLVNHIGYFFIAKGVDLFTSF